MAMRLWILSDFHIEQSIWDLPDPRPAFDVFIAAGDIHYAADALAWLAQRSMGKPVVYIPGNHEWYGYQRRNVIEEELPAARKLAREFGFQSALDIMMVGELARVRAMLEELEAAG